MNGNVHALLVGASCYWHSDLSQLPLVKNDLQIMKNALNDGLKIPADNINICGEDGKLIFNDLMNVLSFEYEKSTTDDVFIFYFSGHGHKDVLCLSDVSIRLSELLSVLKCFRSKNIIVMLDSCHSGLFQFNHVDVEKYEKDLEDIIGIGNVIFASSRPEEVSGFDKDVPVSFFTSCIVSAINNIPVKKGRKSLFDIIEHTMLLMNRRNDLGKNTSPSQSPVLKDNLTGTIYFDVEDYRPFETEEYHADHDEYTIVNVKPNHTFQKRYTVEVILKNENVQNDDIKRITKDVANECLYLDIYDGPEAKDIHLEKPADIIWCHFGCDETDITQSNFKYMSTWKKMDDFTDASPIKEDQIIVENNVKMYDVMKTFYEEDEELAKLSNEDILRLADILTKKVLLLKDLYNDVYTDFLNGTIAEDDVFDFIDENQEIIDGIDENFSKIPVRTVTQATVDLYGSIISDVSEIFNYYNREKLRDDSLMANTFFINKALNRINESLNELRVAKEKNMVKD